MQTCSSSSAQRAATSKSAVYHRNEIRAFRPILPSRLTQARFHNRQPTWHAAKPVRAAKTDSEMLQSMEVENSSTDYCDDFVCTSSPAVEQTVKSFARDVIRIRHTKALYQPDTEYKDGFRSFKGRDKYDGKNWVRELITKPVTEVTRLQMVDKGVAQVDWVVTGQAGNSDVRIPVVSKITLNLLTGRITEHIETWNLGSCSPLTAIILNINRLLWALQAASRDAGDDLSKATASFSSMDDDNSSDYMNSADPTRFYQQQQQNNQMTDAFTIATLVAALYAVFKAFEALETLN